LVTLQSPDRFRIPIGGPDAVSALAYTANRAASRVEATLMLGHGAGAGQTSPFMVSFAAGLADRGLDVITFNFLYTEQGRRAPDRGPHLEACYRAVVETTRVGRPEVAGRPLLIGGKSMGGRIASQIVAAPQTPGLNVAGLVLLGYPLHPPGRPDRMRDAHLHRIGVPMLLVQGSRDTFGTPDELRPVLAALPTARLHVVEGGDHSLIIRRKSAPPREQIYATVMDEIVRWVRTVVGSASQN
jgi:predicted alpha/beta-hydrolase family hydrolase